MSKPPVTAAGSHQTAIVTPPASAGLRFCLQVRYFDNRNFTVSAYTVPAAMTCPGSKAAEFYACFAGPDQESECLFVVVLVSWSFVFVLDVYTNALERCRPLQRISSAGPSSLLVLNSKWWTTPTEQQWTTPIDILHQPKCITAPATAACTEHAESASTWPART